MKFSLRIALVALVVLTITVANPVAAAATSTIARTLEPAGAPVDMSPHYDAVGDFVLTCDAAAFAKGRHQVPKHRSARVNDDGHHQPFADVLYTSFRAHGRQFRFQLLLNRNLFAAGMHHEFQNGDGSVDRVRAVARAYIGVNDTDGEERMHAVVGDDGIMHATVIVGQEMFTVDVVDRHVEGLAHRFDEIVTKAGERRMTMVLLAGQSLQGSLLHHGEAVSSNPFASAAAAAVKADKVEAATTTTSVTATTATATTAMSPIRKLLTSPGYGKNSKAIPQRWEHCYDGEEQGRALTLGVAVDTAFWSVVCKKQTARCEREIAELLSDMNTVYVPQLNLYMKLVKTLIIKKTNLEDKLQVFWNGVPKGKSRTNCSGAQKKAEIRLEAFGRWRESNHGNIGGLWHLLTSCKLNGGLRGIGYVGTVCLKTRTGVGLTTTSRGSSTYWITAAHEVGHNLGAHHSFERGQGKTGGLMDYGDGKLRFVYQFNSKYRKYEVCKAIDGSIPSWYSFGLVRSCYAKVENPVDLTGKTVRTSKFASEKAVYQ